MRVYLFVVLRRVRQDDIGMGSLQVEETSAYCNVNHRTSASNYQLSNMKRPAQDWNRWPERLEVRTLTVTPPSPLICVFIPQREPNKSNNWSLYKYLFYYSLIINHITHNDT